MNKKEMIASIKDEIFIIGDILRANKIAFKTNQRKSNLGLTDFVKLEVYPFLVKKGNFGSYYKLVDGRYYYNFNNVLCNFDSETAKCHLTCLHIVYNMLRTKKVHCHNIERNEYYVRYFDKFIQGLLSEVTEEQDVVLPTAK